MASTGSKWNSQLEPIRLELGYAYLPASKLKVLAYTEKQFNYIPIENFGLQKVPVIVEGLFKESKTNTDAILIGYNYYLMNIHNDNVSTLYYCEGTAKEEKIILNNFTRETNFPILVYDNSLSFPKELIRSFIGFEMLKKPIREKVDFISEEEAELYELENEYKLNLLYDCYDTTYRALINVCGHQKTLMKNI